MKNQIELIKEKLEKNGIFPPKKKIECTDQEIQSIENRFHIKLPSKYKLYLKVMGKLFDFEEGINNGLDLNYNNLHKFRQHTIDNIIDNKITSFSLPQEAFVFAIKDFDIAYYFLTNVDDPVVFEISSSSKNPRIKANSFLDYLNEQVDELMLDYE